jgi:hypothetical protein
MSHQKIINKKICAQIARHSIQSSALGPPTPSPVRECCSSLMGPWGETHSLAGEGVRGPNSDDGTDILAVYVGLLYIPATVGPVDPSLL